MNMFYSVPVNAMKEPRGGFMLSSKHWKCYSRQVVGSTTLLSFSRSCCCRPRPAISKTEFVFWVPKHVLLHEVKAPKFGTLCALSSKHLVPSKQ